VPASAQKLHHNSRFTSRWGENPERLRGSTFRVSAEKSELMAPQSTIFRRPKRSLSRISSTGKIKAPSNRVSPLEPVFMGFQKDDTLIPYLHRAPSLRLPAKIF
jgi:hypothetical protein